MRPAFASTKSAAAFTLLLLVLLALPAVMGKNWLPPREQIYDSQSWGNGPYPWLRQQIFAETNDIDIAFLGSSHMLRGIDTPYVQAALSGKLGRPAVVRSIAWVGSGYDGLFLIAQDLLQHRHVRQLIFYDEEGVFRNAAIPGLFRFGENVPALHGLTLTEKGLYYFASLIGLPRTLLSLVRTNIPAALVSEDPGFIEPHDASFVEAPRHLGAVAYTAPSHLDQTPFTPYQPVTAHREGPSIYTATSSNQDFVFASTPLPVWQTQFARQFARLAESHGCRLVMLDIPTLDTVQEPVLHERAFWPALFSSNLVLVGIPGQKLFAGLSKEDVRKLFSDQGHLNQNGMEFFTSLITPALLELYAAPVNP